MIKFGPSGAADRFYLEGNKHTEQMPAWIKANGLDCFEYSFGRGVNVGEAKAASIKSAFEESGVEISVHAPYFINLATPEDDKAVNSFNYILSSAVTGRAMGASRVVFHPASQGKDARDVAVKRTVERLKELKVLITEHGFEDIRFCPETMGKLAQIGTIEEITDFCTLADFYYPCVDFGHLNCRLQGGLDYAEALDALFDGIGEDRAKRIHIHFSKIEYTAGGEKMHLTFADDNVFLARQLL